MLPPIESYRPLSGARKSLHHPLPERSERRLLAGSCPTRWTNRSEKDGRDLPTTDKQSGRDRITPMELQALPF